MLAGIAFLIYRVYSKESFSQSFSPITEQYESGNYTIAKSMLLEMIEKDKSNSNAWQFLGTCLIELEQYDSAKIAYNHALEIDPNNYQAITGLGITKRDEGDFEGAAKQYRKALELKPGDANAHTSMVIIELKAGNYKNAVIHGEKARKSDSEKMGIVGNLMLAYHFNGQFELRDELIQELKLSDYPYTENLLLVVDGSISL